MQFTCWLPPTYIYQEINITFIKPGCHCRVFNLHLLWAQSMNHLPMKGEVKPATANLAPNVGPWYVDTLLPASSNQVSNQTKLQHHHQLA